MSEASAFKFQQRIRSAPSIGCIIILPTRLKFRKTPKYSRMTQKGFWVNFLRRRLVASGIHPAQAAELAPQVSAYMSEAYKPETHVPEDARTLLKFLKESGYMLGMVSNREVSLSGGNAKTGNWIAIFSFFSQAEK